MLSHEGTRLQYHSALDRSLPELPLLAHLPVEEKLPTLWNWIVSSVKMASAETLPNLPCRRRPWLSSEAAAAGSHANSIRDNPSVSKREKSAAFNRYRRLRRRDFKARVTRLRDQLQAAHVAGDLHSVFKLTKPFDPSRLPCTPDSFKQEITSHFRRLVEYPASSPLAPTPLTFTPYVPSAAATQSLSLGRAPGHDGIQGDLLRWGSPRLQAFVHEFVCSCWASSSVPAQANTSHIILLPKKPKPSLVSDYRGISLLPSLYKIVEATVLPELRSVYEINARDTQYGFRKGRSCSDAISVLSRTLEKRKEFALPSVCVFLDFRSAFDSVSHSFLLSTLRLAGVNEHHVRMITSLLQGTSQIRFGQTLSEPIHHLRGTRQGALLSPLLFNFCIDRIISTALADCPGVLDLLYADDVCIISPSMEQCMIAVQRITSAALEVGLVINPTKSGVISTLPTEVPLIQPGVEPIPVVPSYKYLGTRLTGSGRIAPNEIPSRVQSASCTFQRLSCILFSDVPVKLKSEVYSLAVRAVLLYGTETWGAPPSQIKKFLSADRRLLRRFCPGGYTRISQGGNIWKPCPNSVLHARAGIKPIEEAIEARRWNFLERVVTSTSACVKRVHQECDEALGRRPRGRPRTTWHRLMLKQAKEEKLINVSGWRNLWLWLSRRLNTGVV